MAKFKEILCKVREAICKSTAGNFITGIVWFMSFVGGTGYLFYYPESGLFAVLDILVSLFLLMLSYTGKPEE